jgi:DNA-binding response OmpR family regulator
MEKSPTVLVIDDNNTSRSFANKALRGQCQVECASSAAAGLIMASEVMPDVILMDVEMPGLNGYQACEILKHTPNTAHIPIIFVSSLGNLTSRMHGYEAGGDDYLIKPFEKDELIAKIQLLVKQNEAQTELSTQAEQAQQTAHEAMSWARPCCSWNNARKPLSTASWQKNCFPSPVIWD